ncbi:MAG: glycosyltransferase family 2 protein [Candidatus Aenigmarchaeota archaeon]|nr:glycosyltransferase family 2 protein [Candidatus Aenigmarchaeota archaeon]
MLSEILLALLLFYFHINYFFSSLLALLPLRSSGHAPGKAPKVSIIITTHNEESVIEPTLRSAAALDYPDFEIIIVDSSSDRTPEIARKYGRVIRDRARKGKPHALNLGVRAAKGEVLYILDADSLPEKGALRKLVAALQTHDVATGINILQNKQSFTARIARLQVALFNALEIIGYNIVGTVMLAGKNFAIKKETLKKMGHFSHELAEDVDLSLRLYDAGKTVALVDAFCFEQAPPYLSWYLKQQRRWILGGGKEVLEFFGKADLGRVLFLGPLGVSLAFSHIFALVFLLHFLATGSALALGGFILTGLIYVIAAARFLDADDVLLAPVTMLALGALQLYVIVSSLAAKLGGAEIKWEKTPKVKN